jgi:dipeptidase E
MKLLLTSAGLRSENLKKFFAGQFERLDNKKACVITSGRTEEEQFYIDYSMSEMKDFGIDVSEINIAKNDSFPDLPEFDIYYVCGGNTFYILDRMRKTGIDKILIEAVRKNKLYVGVSAGSIITGPDIEVTEIGINPDSNDVNLLDMSGLKFVPFIITPHYNQEEEKDVEEFKKKRAGETVIALTDGQAVFADDSGYKIIE